jgi:glutathione S-transferase
MKLYYHPGSTNARKSRLAAALLRIDLELQLVDVFAGAHRKPEYLAINPNGMIPTLVDDDFVLWESNAIAQYLASKSAAMDLFPAAPRARADVSRWHCWDLAHWTPATQTLAFERLFKKIARIGEPDAGAVDRGTANFHRFASVLDGHLSGRRFLVCDALTLADTSVAAGLTYAVEAQIPVDGYSNLERWFESIAKLDAWKATAPPPMG